MEPKKDDEDEEQAEDDALLVERETTDIKVPVVADLAVGSDGDDVRGKERAEAAAAVRKAAAREKELEAAFAVDRVIETTGKRLQAARSPKVVSEIHDNVKQLVANEAARGTSLDTKATGMLAVVGFSVTVVTALVAGFLFQVAKDYGDYPKAMLAVLFATMVIVGVIAAVLSVLVLRMRDYEEPSIKALFDETTIADTNAYLNPVYLGAYEDHAQAVYRRMVTTQLSHVFETNRAVNDSKARMLRKAQVYFTVFVGLVGLVAVILAILFAVSFKG